MRLLQATGAEVQLLDSGCCGMAGPFGFEREKFGISQKLAERVLLPAVRRDAKHSLIVTDGFSCREQIAQNTGVRALHLAEVLAGARNSDKIIGINRESRNETDDDQNTKRSR